MATKLDQDFVAHIKKSHANSLAGINALVSEVERLEALQEKKDRALQELMMAYERRIRSDCATPEALALKPWECSEYCAARDALQGIL